MRGWGPSSPGAAETLPWWDSVMMQAQTQMAPLADVGPETVWDGLGAVTSLN